MKRDGDSSSAAVAIVLMLSVFLVCIQNVSVRNAFSHMLPTIKHVMIAPAPGCSLSSFTDTIVVGGWPS